MAVIFELPYLQKVYNETGRYLKENQRK